MKRIIAGLLLCSIVTPAFAADKGAYAGVTLGTAHTGDIAGRTLSSSRNTVYGFLAGYRFTAKFAIEAQQLGAGKFGYVPDVSGKSEVLSLTGLGRLAVAGRYTAYGRLGVAATESELSSSGLPATGARRIAYTYGAGMQYKIMPGIATRLEWNRYTSAIKNSDGSHQDFLSSIWTLGAVIKF
jgi:opacity protein-like surface antigen